MSLFTHRKAFKPFEYPSVVPFKKAIHESFWTVTEFNFNSDVQDYHVNLTDVERSVIKNTLLAISQIEVSVKKFWARLGDRFPKAEFDQVGISFAEAETRHADAYSHLLEMLGLNREFDSILEVPAILGRVDYLAKMMDGYRGDARDYTGTLALFSLFIENCSLFSQFLIIKSFCSVRNLLKDVDNVVQSTLREEVIHALFGAHLIELIRSEHPQWFDADFSEKIREAANKAFAAECRIIDWIYEQGDLPFLRKSTVVEFLKDRFNQSLNMVGEDHLFEVDRALLSDVRWFQEELLADVRVDFFNKKSSAYSKNLQPVTADDLF